MNSCILMAEIVDKPQLRHTPDGLERSEMMIQISGLRPDDPPAILRAVSWGNSAKEIYQTYDQGAQVILEGRLGMISINRPEGFKETMAEVTIQKIYAIGANVASMSPATNYAPTRTPEPAVSNYQPSTPAMTTAHPGNVRRYEAEAPAAPPSYEPSNYPASTPETDIDDIPF